MSLSLGYMSLSLGYMSLRYSLGCLTLLHENHSFLPVLTFFGEINVDQAAL